MTKPTVGKQKFFGFMNKDDQRRCSKERFARAFPNLSLRVEGSIVLVDETDDSDRILTLVSELDGYLNIVKLGTPSWDDFKSGFTFVEAPPKVVRSFSSTRERLRSELADDIGLSGINLETAFAWLTYDVPAKP